MTDYEKIEAIMSNEGIHSLRSFASVIGISAQNLYDIKSGKCRLSKVIVGKIQEKFKNISSSWLATGEGEMLVTPTGCSSGEYGGSLLPIVESQQETIKLQAKIIEQQSATIQQLIDQQKEAARRDCPAGCAGVAGA